MPSIGYRAPFLAISGLGAVAVLRLRYRRARRRRSTSDQRPGTRRHAARRGQAKRAAMTTQPHRSELRTTFHRDVDRLEQDLQAMGDLARIALARATRALTVDDQALCLAVVDADDEIDRRYLDIERRVVEVLARQAPVASELRLLTAILHVNLHLERIGDMAVNVARLARLAAGVPRRPLVVGQLEEIGQTAVWMVDLAMQTFRERDAVGCQRLPLIDDRVDELNRSMLTAVLAAVKPFEQLGWGVHMYGAARQLERAADHAVDIAEQVWFLVTGELREFGGARAPL
jgi:phosphate transport system protein